MPIAATRSTVPPGRRDLLCVTALVTSSEVSSSAVSARGWPAPMAPAISLLASRTYAGRPGSVARPRISQCGSNAGSAIGSPVSVASAGIGDSFRAIASCRTFDGNASDASTMRMSAWRDCRWDVMRSPKAVSWPSISPDRRRTALLAGPTIRRRRLGIDLRRLREQSSLRLEEVAQHLGVAPSTLSRIETGKAPTRTSYLALMLDLYGVDDPEQRRLFMDSAREGQRKGWWAGSDELLPTGTGSYLGLEAEASAVRAFQTQVVPDLVRTQAYARAVVTASRPELAPEQVDRVVAVQLR